jgi:negative regulator of sigma-B (phosphoserine phosphatase)
MANPGRARTAARPALSTAPPRFDWAIAARPLPGEELSGDRAVVTIQGDRALVAAIDGLGHGPEAAYAADVAVQVLQALPHADAVEAAERCHEALSSTRGAAISIAVLADEPPTMTWLGIGTVEGRLVRDSAWRARSESLLLRGGVAGHELPPLTPATLPVERGDLLLFATDGVRDDFADSLGVSGTCPTIAERVLSDHGRTTDDALVVVLRYLGSTA